MNKLTLNNISVAKKLSLMTLVAFLGMILISFLLLLNEKGAMFEDRKLKTRNTVEVAHSLIQTYVKKYKEGELTKDKAQDEAMAAVKSLRYDGNNYFWINDMQSKMIMHPFKPELNGKNLSETKDPTGTFLFNEMVEVVKESGEGYVDYMWAKPGTDSDKLYPKISFVKGVPEWGWVIGSGIYVDDVEASYM